MAKVEQTIHEGRLRFVIPRRRWYRELTPLAALQSQHSHDGEQGPQDRCGPRNGEVGPQALGLHTEMRPSLFKRDLHRPAHDDPWQDLRWCGLQIGTEKGVHPQFVLRVTHEYIADVDGR